ncbi:hypothetical protein A2U01_0080017, partial [Trifolium medium]|nr:hypothetical protein [Trifolium medium]
GVGAWRQVAKKVVKEGLSLARGAGSCGASRRFLWRVAPCLYWPERGAADLTRGAHMFSI